MAFFSRVLVLLLLTAAGASEITTDTLTSTTETSATDTGTSTSTLTTTTETSTTQSAPDGSNAGDGPASTEAPEGLSSELEPTSGAVQTALSAGPALLASALAATVLA
jgi:carbohydrate-binding DOMON domain-containing protein